MVGRFVWFGWWVRADPPAAELWLRSWAAALGVLAGYVGSEEDEEIDSEDAPISLLRAATDWFLGLELPGGQAELWGDPPLRARLRQPTPQPAPDP